MAKPPLEPKFAVCRIGRRSYIQGETFPLRQTLRAAGCKWDPQRKAWWTGSRRHGADIVNGLNKGCPPLPRSSAVSTSARVVRGRAIVNGKPALLLAEANGRLLVATTTGSRSAWIEQTPERRIVKRFRAPVSIDMLNTFRQNH